VTGVQEEKKVWLTLSNISVAFDYKNKQVKIKNLNTDDFIIRSNTEDC
jgi:hypothetical protein